jgi:hypothetical protein
MAGDAAWVRSAGHGLAYRPSNAVRWVAAGVPASATTDACHHRLLTSSCRLCHRSW